MKNSNKPQIASDDRVMKRPEVENITGYKCSRIYELMSEGKFPPSIRLGANRVGWLASEVYQWLADRVAESRKENAGG